MHVRVCKYVCILGKGNGCFQGEGPSGGEAVVSEGGVEATVYGAREEGEGEGGR